MWMDIKVEIRHRKDDCLKDDMNMKGLHVEITADRGL